MTPLAAVLIANAKARRRLVWQYMEMAREFPKQAAHSLECAAKLRQDVRGDLAWARRELAREAGTYHNDDRTQ